MKSIIFVFALIALSAVQVSAAYSCHEKCIQKYCYSFTPYNEAKSTKCVQDAVNTMELVKKTCQKQQYSMACVKQRISTDRDFLEFYGCMQDCYPNGIIQVDESPIAGKIHDLTKSRKRGQDTTTPPTVPPTVPPTQPDSTPKPKDTKKTGSQILNCFIGLVSVFLGVLIF
ncbi:transmembrane protein, putative (macronuclear) [Tetrahymena thermophila SB210]|uniref:Transmembrane protein, putative n=1 Tax=Tetrahymena thermophila (strain SB210) TaxID=312017 RepID=I7MN07_TETTS|nr:transmembrane protein, putative [Tetrahymena thermophila SB210]EAS07678.3 transmembrane protein, putative [Tetrahymena thermophila SB210]|eukprot:XP_001027920.3 transmembrane protein, putative [Tetrahymena thermophila SB210]